MMVMQTAPLAALHDLPEPDGAPREVQPMLEGVPAMLDWLAREGFDGVVSAHSGERELSLLFIRGVMVGASLRAAPRETPQLGFPAVAAFCQSVNPATALKTRIMNYPRPIVECLTAAFDADPTSRALSTVDQFREVLKEMASRGHNGLVDLAVGGSWGRVLFQQGRPLGVYDSNNSVVAPSLASVGRLVASGVGSLTVRSVPRGPLRRLQWPVMTTQAVTTHEGTRDDGRDKRIEDNFLWLITHVERDWDRAAKSNKGEGKAIQALAAFVNAMYSFAVTLASSSERGIQAPRLSERLQRLREQHPALGMVEVKDQEIDINALGRRFKSASGNPTAAWNTYRELAGGLLALTGTAVEVVLQDIGQTSVRNGCLSTFETWLRSQEASLTRPLSEQRE